MELYSAGEADGFMSAKGRFCEGDEGTRTVQISRVARPRHWSPTAGHLVAVPMSSGLLSHPSWARSRSGF